MVTVTNEPALTSQVMHLQRQYMEYIQGAKQAQQLRQEHLAHNITLSNISNLSQIGATNTTNAYQNAMHSKAGDIALRGRAYSTSSAGSTGGAYAQSNALRGGANSSAVNSAQARLYTLSASTAASTANLNSNSLHNNGLHSASFHHPSNHSNGQLHSMYHSTGQLHGLYPSNGFFLDPNTEDTSMAAKGLNLAFNFVNELLKCVKLLRSCGCFDELREPYHEVSVCAFLNRFVCVCLTSLQVRSYQRRLAASPTAQQRRTLAARQPVPVLRRTALLVQYVIIPGCIGT